jgi:hypothetical protein
MKLNEAQRTPNTANNDTPFVEKDYCGRSTVLLTGNLSFDSSQNGGVVCRDVDDAYVLRT